MNNEDMLLIKSAIALDTLFTEKDEYNQIKTVYDGLEKLSYICDKDSTRIIKLIQSTLKQNLYSKLVSTNLDSKIARLTQKNTYEKKLSKSFTTIDTMLAIRNFQKNNFISETGKKDMRVFNGIENNKLRDIEKTG